MKIAQEAILERPAPAALGLIVISIDGTLVERGRKIRTLSLRLEKSMPHSDFEAAVETNIREATYGLKEQLVDLFHPNFITAGLLAESIGRFDSEAAIRFCEESAMPAEAPMQPWRIRDIAALESSAFAAAEIKFLDSVFVEVLTFLKEDGRWQLAFKSFETTS
jgi:hypothetical protein